MRNFIKKLKSIFSFLCLIYMFFTNSGSIQIEKDS